MSNFEKPNWYELVKGEFPKPPWTEPPLLIAARDMLDCMDSREKQPRCNGADGRAAIEIIMGIYESARRGSEMVQFPVQVRERMVDVLARERKL